MATPCVPVGRRAVTGRARLRRAEIFFMNTLATARWSLALPKLQMRAKRLFVSLELPQAVTQLLVDLDPHLRGVRWLAPEQMHLTLSFSRQRRDSSRGSALGKSSRHIMQRPSSFLLAASGPFPAKAGRTSFGSASAPLIRIYSNCTNACRTPRSPPVSIPICARSIRTSRSRAVAMFRPNPSVLF